MKNVFLAQLKMAIEILGVVVLAVAIAGVGVRAISAQKPVAKTTQQAATKPSAADAGKKIDVQFKDVSVRAIRDKSVKIYWDRMPDAGTSRVEYGTRTSYGSIAPEKSLSYFHVVNLAGLAEGMTYHFRIRSKDYLGNETVSGDYAFKTRTKAELEEVIKAARADKGLAKTYYVRSDGNDSNDGLTIKTAWKSPVYAASKSDAGDTIYLVDDPANPKDGVWRNVRLITFPRSGIDVAPITLSGYGGKPLLQNDPFYTFGSEKPYDQAFNFKQNSHITIRNIAFRNYNGFTKSHSLGSYITIDGIDYRNFGEGITISGGTVKESTVYNSLINSVVANAMNSKGSPPGTYYKMKSAWNSVQLHGNYYTWPQGDAKPSHHITVAGNRIFNSKTHGLIDIIGYQYNITIRDNELFNGTFPAIFEHGNTNHNQVMERFCFSNNRIHDMKTPTCFAYLHDSFIYNNVFYNMEDVSLNSTTVYPGVFPDNLTISHNTIRNAIAPMTKMWLWPKGTHTVSISNVKQKHYYTGTSVYHRNNIASYAIGGFGVVTIRDSLPSEYAVTLANDGTAVIEYADNTVFAASSKAKPENYKIRAELGYYPDKSKFSVQSNIKTEYTHFKIVAYPMTARPSAGVARVTVKKFDTASKDGVLVEFTAGIEQGGEVTFSVSDLSPGKNYTIKKGRTVLSKVVADLSGRIKFSNAAWSGTTAFSVEGPAATNVTAPVFFPAPGDYESAQNVAVICRTPGAVVRYTLDGSEPTEKSKLYSIPLAVAATTTLKAKAWRDARIPSTTVRGTYTLADKSNRGSTHKEGKFSKRPKSVK